MSLKLEGELREFSFSFVDCQFHFPFKLAKKVRVVLVVVIQPLVIIVDDRKEPASVAWDDLLGNIYIIDLNILIVFMVNVSATTEF